MTSNVVTNYNRRVHDLADGYSTEGYEVLTQPAKDELPPFLRHFHPDLIAIGPEQSVVVEVKAAGKVRRTDYWREMAEAVSAHNEWKLVIEPGVSQEGTDESMSPAEVEEQLTRAAGLAETGELGASLLVTWSAVEAAMRLIAERYDVKVFDPDFRSLMSRLVSEGLMDRQDYKFLGDLLGRRNAVAHGFRQPVAAEDIVRLRAIARRLLTE